MISKASSDLHNTTIHFSVGAVIYTTSCAVALNRWSHLSFSTAGLLDVLRSCLWLSYFNSSIWALISIRWENIIRPTQPRLEGPPTHTSALCCSLWMKTGSKQRISTWRCSELRQKHLAGNGLSSGGDEVRDGGEKGGLGSRNRSGTAIDQLSYPLTVGCSSFHRKMSHPTGQDEHHLHFKVDHLNECSNRIQFRNLTKASIWKTQ